MGKAIMILMKAVVFESTQSSKCKWCSLDSALADVFNLFNHRQYLFVSGHCRAILSLQ